jgi:hypothetical protein
MTRFEYLIRDFREHSNSPAGREKHQGELNDLGREGWEIIERLAAWQVGSTQFVAYLFKRECRP